MSNLKDEAPLLNFLAASLACAEEQVSLTPLAGGYSNLSFRVQTPDQKLILRRPPFGEKIAKAHDMVREFKILQSLQKAGYTKSPQPHLLCEDESILGAPFFLMEDIEGPILRNKVPDSLSLGKEEFRQLSIQAVDCLVELHGLELQESGLKELGKAEGYTQRQVQGWSERYARAKTQELPEVETAALWLQSNLPATETAAFLHNDFKYDNLVLDPQQPSKIRSVLDWEMATLGNPLMDLGTTLAYWAEEKDPLILKSFNLSHLPGNMSRQEVIARYIEQLPGQQDNMKFYYVFGLFKVAVIAQQIFKRFSQGYSTDARFAQLIHVVEAAGKKAVHVLQTDKI